MDLIKMSLFGTIILIVIACVVILLVRLYKNHKKNKTDHLAEEAADNEREKDLTKQQEIGRDLEIYLKEVVQEKKDDRYVINCYPNNGKAKTGTEFSLVVRDTKYGVDNLQVSINVPKNNISFIGHGDVVDSFPLNQMQKVRNMLRQKIEAL